MYRQVHIALHDQGFRTSRTGAGTALALHSWELWELGRLHMKDRVWLVAHDFSACAAAAADVALEDLLDSRRGGRIVLLHVFTVLVPGASIEGAAIGAGFAHLEEAARMEATRVLERVAEGLRSKETNNGVAGAVKIEIVTRMSTPAEGILEEADACGATRIVLGTHGRTGVKHLLLGSVAERVMRRAKVPVLVAHTKEPS